MKTAAAMIAAALAAQGLAAPAPTPTALCGPTDTAQAKPYSVGNNLWGVQKAAAKGSQCTTVDKSDGTGVQWHTTWQWNGNGGVVSYANNQFALDKKPLLSSITKLSTTAEWKYNNTDIKADVAYDLFTAKDVNHPEGSGDFEIMLWLARFGDGINPKGTKKDTTNLAGQDWDVYFGPGDPSTGDTQATYTFLATKEVDKFDGDLKPFFDYLSKSQQFPTDQNLIEMQFGSEAWGADAATTFTVSNFSADLE